MEKIILSSILMAGVVMTAASGAEGPDQKKKAKCLSNPTELVWQENSTSYDCVPKSRNICTKDKYKAYCNTAFKTTHVGSAEDAKKLIDLYAKTNKLGAAEQIFQDGPHLAGQDYIGYKFASGEYGNYMVFEFDDISENISNYANYNLRRGYCIALGGTPKVTGRLDKSSYAAIPTVGAIISGPVGAAAVLAIDTIRQWNSDSKIVVCENMPKAKCDSIPEKTAHNSNDNICMIEVQQL